LLVNELWRHFAVHKNSVESLTHPCHLGFRLFGSAFIEKLSLILGDLQRQSWVDPICHGCALVMSQRYFAPGDSNVGIGPAKLEASVGQIDETRYMQAEFGLQPAVDVLYWQCYEESWPVLKYLDKWMELRSTLPPKPNVRKVTPEQQQREIDEMLEKINGTDDGAEDKIDPYGLDGLTEEIRAEEEAYLREKERNLSEK
jgi:hypothetical protein